MLFPSVQLSEVQGCVLQWREEMVGVTQRLREVEENMRERVSYRVADYNSRGRCLAMRV